jgi:hypothetical protein
LIPLQLDRLIKVLFFEQLFERLRDVAARRANGLQDRGSYTIVAWGKGWGNARLSLSVNY